MRFRRWLKWIIGLMCVVLLIGLLWPAVQTIHWVGFAELEVTFRVVDGKTGEPIPNAEIHVQNDGGFGQPKDVPKEFDLRTDSVGIARVSRLHCMTAGQSSGCRDSWNIYLPDWCYFASASGHVKAESVWIEENPEHRWIKRPARGEPAQLTITITLQPKP